MVYLTGDTHGAFDINKINPTDQEYMRKLQKDDTLIICGDFGCIWDGASFDRFWLNCLESLPFTTVFVDGNHENFSVLNTYPTEEWHGGKVHKIRSNIFHLKRGEIFDIEGEKYFAFGGAASHDGDYRVEGKSWWKEELPVESEVDNAWNNLAKHNYKVDYVLTHDVYKKHPLSSKYPVDLSLYGPEFLNIHNVLQGFEDKIEYKKWFTGHYHHDLVHYDDKKRPCCSLFNKVVDINDIDLNTFDEV